MAYDRSEWELSEFGNLIETENEKYGEIVQIAERRRTAEKYVKIRKIRQEMTWGVRLTKTLIICYCGPYVAYKESILAELVPPFQFYLRDKEYYTTYKGTPFRLPDAYKFKYYENAVECWHHNAILSNKKQMKILVRYNFEKFVRALETIGEPTAAKIQYDYDTCVSSISPFSESEDEESEADDEDDRSEGEEQDHSINKIYPFSFSGDEENESDDEDDRGEGEEQDHSINKIFPFSFSGDEENESDDEDDRGEGEEQDHSINKIFPFSFSGDEESEFDSKSDCSDESKSNAALHHEVESDEEEEHDQSDDELPRLITLISESDDESDDEDEDSEEGKQDHSIDEISSLSESDYEGSESDSKSDCSDESTSKAEFGHEGEPDEEEEHDQSDDDLPMITPYSGSENGESESYYGSDEQSEEEEQDHHSDKIIDDEEEMYFAKEEDYNDRKFDSKDVPNLQLLHCREEVGQKCDPEESDLGILFGAEEHNHNLDLKKVGSLSSVVEKVEKDDVLDSEDVSNKDQFNEIEEQGPFNQEQQQKQQEHCNEHMVEHRPTKNKKKRKNILMGWVCSKILKVFVKSKVLL